MKPIFLIILLFAGIQANAQLDSCNVFLQGNYVEVGINFNGAYGSSVFPPAVGYCGVSYHPKGGSPVANDSGATGCPSIACITRNGGLGFVADPDKDGWTIGTPCPYYGDYFLPGSPQEGWSIEADGIQANNFNGDSSGSCTQHICGICTVNDASGHKGHGSNISYSTSGSIITAIWQGTWDSLLITQTTTLDTSQTFFVTHVVIKNIAATTRHGIYYQRTVDPDNAEPESGSFATLNKIEYQLPDTAHKVLVSTWGTDGSWSTIIPSAYLGLGTMDSNAKCFVFITSGLQPPTNEMIDSLYGKYAAFSSIPGGGDTAQTWMHQGDSETSDIGVGLVFKIGDLAPVDTAVIAYAYAFKRGVDLDSALKSTLHPLIADTSGNHGDTTHHTGVNSVKNQQKDIHIYPNPLTNEMTVSGLSASDQIKVYDMMGKNVAGWIVVKDGSNNFNTAGLSSGMYLLSVFDKDGNVKARLPIQKL